VVETLPGAAPAVAERMGRLWGMRSIAGDGDRRITARWSVCEGDTALGLSEVLHAMNPEIVEVVPTLVEEEE
jgi:hypothetical protein